MVRIGNFFFHYRNGLFPLLYAMLFLNSKPLLADYRTAAAIGFAIAFLGQLLRAITIGLDYIIRGGRNRHVYADGLVQGGVFSHCRNPLYVGNFMIIVGLGVASNSIFFIAFGIPLFAFIYRAIIAAEENFLRGKFGEEFDRYCARVNRILPNFANFGATLSSMKFNWKRLISAEYGSTFIWTAGLIGLTLKNAWFAGQYDLNRPFTEFLWAAMAFVILAYAVARILKKTGKLAVPRPAPAPASAS